MLKTIKGKMNALALFVILAVAGVVGGWWFAFDHLKVNGPIYNRIVTVKDLVSDILPPPEFILESYLATAEALNASPQDIPQIQAHLQHLKADYQERHAYWEKAHLDPQISQVLLVKSYEPAMAFYTVAETKLLPAVSANDQTGAKAAFAELTGLYQTHRRAIEDLVSLSDALNKQVEKDAESSEVQTKITVVSLSAAVAAIALIWTLFTSRSILSPLADLIGAVERMGRNETSQPVDGTDRHDEIAPLAKALETARLAMISEGERLIAERKAAELRHQRHQQMEQATSEFNQVVGHLLSSVQGTVGNLHGAADSLASNAQNTKDKSAVVSAATEEANSSIQTVASAGTELAASIQEISRQVQHSASITRDASIEAEQANTRMEKLAQTVDRIGEVVSLIANIANQTNLLALNATIESARAGDAGKGFAVVAHEVKNLAGQTGKATEEIAAQIAAVQSDTQSAVSSIAGIVKTIAKISELSDAISGAVTEQENASGEIAQNVEQASVGTREVAVNIAGVADAAAATGQMALDLVQTANDLKSKSTGLEGEVRKFLTTVAAA